MSLAPGTTVGRYQIRDLIGSGGMGEVYKAHDPTLGRSVALKVLKESLSAEADRVWRFLQEARAASALNHPNILTIHEVGDHNSSRFIVSEFVEGETLRQRLERGQLTLREILDVAIQTASALAAAHTAGIVHRDIKPENLMLRPDGYVKVLDFGVAKLAQPAVGQGDATLDAGATFASNTGVGVVVGTMAYMSPEQARGLNVDGRTDSFSLGIVLYELVTGRAPFVGATASDVLVAILDREPPPLRSLAKGLPLQLEWIIAKALDKDPALRYQNIADLRVDLMRLKSAIESGRIAESTGAAALDMAAADQPLDVELSDDSTQVQAVSGISTRTIAFAVVALAAVTAAVVFYDRARPGADFPLQLPKGAVVTKARDAVESFGYTARAPRQAANFEDSLSVANVTALAGLPATREAIRAGVVGHWDVGLTTTRDANALTGGAGPQEGEFKVHLDPTGRIVTFETGVSQQPVTAVDRDRATAIGLDSVRRAFALDASRYEFELLQRAFPAGTVEMTWRNPVRQFGHIEQIRVHLQGDRVVRIARSFETPPGFTEPTKAVVAGALEVITPIVVVAAVVASWAFGLFVLIKTRNWDALRQRLPITLCAAILVSVTLATLESSSGWQGMVGLLFIALVIPATLLPAMSGIFLWLRRRSPGRLWAADQLSHGRVLNGAVAASLVDGVMAGAAIMAIQLAADGLGLQVAGFLPSISRELEVIDDGILKIISEGITEATFLTMGLALAVESLDRVRVRPLVATLIIAAGGALVAESRHQTLLAVLPSAGAQILILFTAATLYRFRGFLAVWIAALVSALLPDAMAARSLDDPDLAWRSTMVLALTAALLLLGVWGVVTEYLKRKRTTPAVV